MSTTIKRYLLSLFFVMALYTSSYGQVEKGDNILGFSASISTQSASPTNLTVTGLFSYERYLSQRWAIGIAPTITSITAKSSLATEFGVNVFGNFGFITDKGLLYPYLGILASVNQRISSDDTQGSTSPNNTNAQVSDSGNSTTSFFGGGAKVGLKIFVSERINVDFNVNYSANISAAVNGELIDAGEGGIIQAFAGIGVMLGKKSSN